MKETYILNSTNWTIWAELRFTREESFNTPSRKWSIMQQDTALCLVFSFRSF